MMNITDTGDRFNRQTLQLETGSPSSDASWTLSLLSNDLPQEIQSLTEDQIDLQIVTQDSAFEDTESSMILIPVTITSVSSTADGQTKFYYRQKFDSSGENSNQAEVSGFTTQDQKTDQSQSILFNSQDLYLRISFEGTSQSSQSQQANQASDQQTQRSYA